MPLSAEVGGELIVAPQMPSQEWKDLVRRIRAGTVEVRLSGCGSPGHARIRNGLQHFAHNPGSGQVCTVHGSETDAHLHAKWIICEAARQAGWSADVEHAGPGWIADVLAWQDRSDIKVACEVQWSRQTFDDYRTRQRGYRDAGVRAAWFARHTAHLQMNDSEVPIFELTRDDSREFGVRLCGQALTLPEFVTRLLTGQVQHHDQLISDHAQISVGVYDYPCYKCGCLCLLWNVEGVDLAGRCGQPYPYDFLIGSMWTRDRPEASRDIRNAVTQVARERDLPTAVLSIRYSHTVRHKYMAFSCPHCHALFGDHHLAQDIPYRDPDDVIAVEGHVQVPYQHWCLNAGCGFCI